MATTCLNKNSAEYKLLVQEMGWDNKPEEERDGLMTIVTNAWQVYKLNNELTSMRAQYLKERKTFIEAVERKKLELKWYGYPSSVWATNHLIESLTKDIASDYIPKNTNGDAYSFDLSGEDVKDFDDVIRDINANPGFPTYRSESVGLASSVQKMLRRQQGENSVKEQVGFGIQHGVQDLKELKSTPLKIFNTIQKFLEEDKARGDWREWDKKGIKSKKFIKEGLTQHMLDEVDTTLIKKKPSEPSVATEAGVFAHKIFEGVCNYVIEMQRGRGWEPMSEEDIASIQKWLEDNIQKIFDGENLKFVTLRGGEEEIKAMASNLTKFFERFLKRYKPMATEYPLAYMTDHTYTDDYRKIAKNLEIPTLDPTKVHYHKPKMIRTLVDLIVMDKRDWSLGVVDFKTKGMEDFLEKSPFAYFSEQKFQNALSPAQAVNLQTLCEQILLNDSLERQTLFTDDRLKVLNGQPLFVHRYVVPVDIALHKGVMSPTHKAYDPKKAQETGVIINMRGATIDVGRNLLDDQYVGGHFISGGLYELKAGADIMHRAMKTMGDSAFAPGESLPFHNILNQHRTTMLNAATKLGSMGMTNIRRDILKHIFHLDSDTDYVGIIAADYEWLAGAKKKLNVGGLVLTKNMLEQLYKQWTVLDQKYSGIAKLLKLEGVINEDGHIVFPEQNDVFTLPGYTRYMQQSLGLDVSKPEVMDIAISFTQLVRDLKGELGEVRDRVLAAQATYIRKEFLAPMTKLFLETKVVDNLTAKLMEEGRKISYEETKSIHKFVNRKQEMPARQVAFNIIAKNPELYKAEAENMAMKALGMMGNGAEAMSMFTMLKRFIESVGAMSGIADPVMKQVSERLHRSGMKKTELLEEYGRRIKDCVSAVMKEKGMGGANVWENFIAYRPSDKWMLKKNIKERGLVRGMNMVPYIPKEFDTALYEKTEKRAMREIAEKYHVEASKANMTLEQKEKVAEMKKAVDEWYDKNTQLSSKYVEEVNRYSVEKTADGEVFNKIVGKRKSAIKAGRYIVKYVLDNLKEGIDNGFIDDDGYEEIRKMFIKIYDPYKPQGKDLSGPDFDPKKDFVTERQSDAETWKMLKNPSSLLIYNNEHHISQTEVGAKARQLFSVALGHVKTPSDTYKDANYKQIESLSKAQRAFYDLYMELGERYDNYVGPEKKLGQNLPAYLGGRAYVAEKAHGKEPNASRHTRLWGKERVFENQMSWSDNMKFPYTGTFINPNDFSHDLPEGLYALTKSMAHYEAYRQTAFELELFLLHLKDSGVEFDKRLGMTTKKYHKYYEDARMMTDLLCYNESTQKGLVFRTLKQLYNVGTYFALAVNFPVALRSHFQSGLQLRIAFGHKGDILHGNHTIANLNWVKENLLSGLYLSKATNVAGQFFGAHWQPHTHQQRIADWFHLGNDPQYEKLMREEFWKKLSTIDGVVDIGEKVGYACYAMTDNTIKRVTSEVYARNIMCYDKDKKELGSMYSLFTTKGKAGERERGGWNDNRYLELDSRVAFTRATSEAGSQIIPYDKERVCDMIQYMISVTTSVVGDTNRSLMTSKMGAAWMFQLMTIANNYMASLFTHKEALWTPGKYYQGMFEEFMGEDKLIDHVFHGMQFIPIVNTILNTVLKAIDSHNVKNKGATHARWVKHYNKSTMFWYVCWIVMTQIGMWCVFDVLRGMFMGVGGISRFALKHVFNMDEIDIDLHLDKVTHPAFGEKSKVSTGPGGRAVLWSEQQLINLLSKCMEVTNILAPISVFGNLSVAGATGGFAKRAFKAWYQAIHDIMDGGLERFKSGEHKDKSKLAEYSLQLLLP